MENKSYKNLIVWQRAIELTDETYKLTKKFPNEEKYSLISQMRRAAISIPSNIAEGHRRHSDKSYIQFLLVAYGSGGELETQIEICKRNLLLDEKEYTKIENLLEEVMKMLNALINKLRTTDYGLRVKSGIAALPTVLIIGGLIVELAMAATLSAYLFITFESGNRLSNEAFSVARTGIEDAIIKVVRDKNFSTSGEPGGIFTITIGNNSVDVTVSSNVPGFGKTQVLALGKAGSRRRQLEAILDVDTYTGQVDLDVLQETAL